MIDLSSDRIPVLAFIDMFYNSFEVTQRSVTRSRCWQIGLLAQQTPLSRQLQHAGISGMSLHDYRGLAGNARAQMSIDIGITGMLLTWLR